MRGFREVIGNKNVYFDSNIFICLLEGNGNENAIHVATAAAIECELFLTNDKNIRMPKGLDKVLLSDYRSG